ncbi:L,D-transpeptidase family protein [Paracoccus cavernae]|uniref:L,D-transpeptidase family protein n=1 Tax=Paracoccus cavernae TaxID=1571207 RepID=UPI00363A9B8F
MNDKSRFHLSLGLDYPQMKHREAARKAGVDPGGDIMIHGQPNEIAQGFRVKGDWTEGCIAIDDHEIEDIFAMTRIGTEVEIRP